jgi:hypothetical protein
MYSRCTQTFRRLSFLSADTWPQNAIQKAHSVNRCASIGKRLRQHVQQIRFAALPLTRQPDSSIRNRMSEARRE